MTIKDFLETSIKLDINTKAKDYTSQYCSKDSSTASFQSIFEQTNKANTLNSSKSDNNYMNNYSNKDYSGNYYTQSSDYNNTERFDNSRTQMDKQKNAYNHDNGNEKEDYSKIKHTDHHHEAKHASDKQNNKIDEDQKEEINQPEESKTKETAEKTDENKPHEETKSETNQEEITDNTKPAQKPEKTDNISVNPAEILLKDNLLNAKEQQENTDAELEAKAQQVEKLQQEIANKTPALKNAETAKLRNENLPENKAQSSANASNEESSDVISDEEVPEQEAVSEETKTQQALKEYAQSPVKQDKKLMALISEDKLNNQPIKSQLGSLENESLKPLSDKLSELSLKDEAKPLITHLEINNNSSGMDFDNKQQQNELKPAVGQAQNLISGADAQDIGTQKMSNFDRILSSKQSQDLESSILNQVKDKVSTEITSNHSRISIALNPENLGKVNINIVSQNGNLSAQITAENNQTKDILSKNLEVLKQNLADQGIQVGKVVVESQNSSSFNQNTNPDSGFKNFDQFGSEFQDGHYQSNDQNNSQTGSAQYSDNFTAEYDETIGTDSSETNERTEQNSVINTGRVDYKV